MAWGRSSIALLTGGPPVRGATIERGAPDRVRRGEIRAAAVAQPERPAGAGGGLPEGAGAEARGPLPDGAGAGRGRRALAGRRAGLGLPRAVAGRLARWGRRHRPLVSGVAALLVTAVVALSVGTVALSRANARSEANYQMARAAVDRSFTQISESRLLNEPQMEPLRANCWRRVRITSSSWTDAGMIPPPGPTWAGPYPPCLDHRSRQDPDRGPPAG